MSEKERKGKERGEIKQAGRKTEKGIEKGKMEEEDEGRKGRNRKQLEGGK